MKVIFSYHPSLWLGDLGQTLYDDNTPLLLNIYNLDFQLLPIISMAMTYDLGLQLPW
jgi:hypothetical protein